MGGSFGRTSFCRFALSTGKFPEDFITISLEVNSASQSLTSVNNEPGEAGVLKMVRGVESNQDLSEVRVLPTVWTRYNQHGSKLGLHDAPTKPCLQSANAAALGGVGNKKGGKLAGLSSMFGAKKKARCTNEISSG